MKLCLFSHYVGTSSEKRSGMARVVKGAHRRIELRAANTGKGYIGLQ